MNAPAPRIEPTPGRIVHFHLGNPAAPPTGFCTNPKNLYAAMVAAVFEYEPNLNIVNLTVSDAAGFTHAFQLVKLVQAGMPVPGKDPHPLAHWCEWMPYQKAVAAGKIPPTLHQLGATPFNLQQAGRITRIDSLRLAAKGLEMVAAELEEKERNPLSGRTYPEIATQLRVTMPLLEVLANAYAPTSIPHRELGQYEEPSRYAHPVHAAMRALDNDGRDGRVFDPNHHPTITGDGSGQALPPINEVDLRATSARNNQRSDDMTEKEHHGGHHHHKAAETDPNNQKGAATADSAGGPSGTSDTSTNAPADQVGDQGAPSATEQAENAGQGTEAADAPSASDGADETRGPNG